MTRQRVAFRVDASSRIGAGHVMRCMTLAHSLRDRGAVCRFVCRVRAGHRVDRIRSAGFEVCELRFSRSDNAVPEDDSELQDAAATLEALARFHWDWLVVDHYDLGIRWQDRVRESCEHLLVVEDQPARPHRADLLLDQSLGRTPDAYFGLVPAECRVLTGSAYALLRPAFALWRAYSLRRRAQRPAHRWLLSMGGGDVEDVTLSMLSGLGRARLARSTEIRVVLGLDASTARRVRSAARAMPWPTEVHVDVVDMAPLMADADLALGAGGMTAWERCCMGLPSLLRVVASNQLGNAAALHQAGCAIPVAANWDEFSGLCESVANDVGLLGDMQRACARTIDGLGVYRVLEAMRDIELLHSQNAI